MYNHMHTYILTYICSTVFSRHKLWPEKFVTWPIDKLVAFRIGMNKMAEGDEYLDYLDKTLE